MRLSLACLFLATPFLAAQELPPDLVRYTPAKFTQRIATTNGLPSITPMPRTLNEAKYQVPGGLVGIKGWRSELYANASSWRWTERLPVLNSFGFIQHELGWTRRFDDGSKFADVLINTKTGRIFEIRMREKGRDRKGEWASFVDYRNPNERPEGYKPLTTRDCRSCHDGADGPGTGGYAVAMVPGADGVFSYPIPELER